MNISFETNVWQEFALKFNDGLPVDGRYGPQVLFTLAGDDKMYLPPIAAEKIKAAGIGKMELFRIRKAEVKNGSKKGIQWEVQKLGDASEPERSPVDRALDSVVPAVQQIGQFDSMPTEMERKLVQSIDQVKQQKTQRAQSPEKATPAAPPQTAQENAPQQTHLNAAGQTNLSQLLAGCMTAAIDAAVIARDYAHSKGLTIALSEQSIQDLTSTLMIHVQKMAELECKFDVKAAACLNRIQQGGGVQWRQ